MRDLIFNFSLGATVFYLLSGVYLTEKTEHVSEGHLFICIGVTFLAFAISRVTRSTSK